MTLIVGLIGLRQKHFKGTDLLRARLLQGHTSATTTVVLEVAVIAQGHVTDATVSGQIFYLTLALFDIAQDNLSSRYHLLFYL